jgi:hypothetical protein
MFTYSMKRERERERETRERRGKGYHFGAAAKEGDVEVPHYEVGVGGRAPSVYRFLHALGVVAL